MLSEAAEEPREWREKSLRVIVGNRRGSKDFSQRWGEGVKERKEREGKGPPRAEQLALL